MKLSLEELVSKVGNRYKLVALTSARVRELSEGARPLVEIDSKNLADIALAEISSGKISLRRYAKEEKGDQEDT